MLKLEISEDVKATIEYEVEFDGTEEEFIKKYKKIGCWQDIETVKIINEHLNIRENNFTSIINKENHKILLEE